MWTDRPTRRASSPARSASEGCRLIPRWRFGLVSSLFALVTGAAPAQEKADLVLLGGKVATVDPKRPTAEAVAVRGDRILAVGSNQEIKRLVGDATRVIRLDGRFVMPGFIEGHGHYVSLGQSKMMLDLTKAKS